MTSLIKKMERLKLILVEMIVGTVVMGAAMIALPLGIALEDVTLLANPYVLGVVIIGMLFFASVDFFVLILPYIIYRKTPAVQAETDGEFLYIHTKKEAKIPLSDLGGSSVRIELPFLFQKAFVREILIHIFSDEYGSIVLDVPGHGAFRMRYVPHVSTAANELTRYIYVATHSAV